MTSKNRYLASPPKVKEHERPVLSVNGMDSLNSRTGRKVSRHLDSGSASGNDESASRDE